MSILVCLLIVWLLILTFKINDMQSLLNELKYKQISSQEPVNKEETPVNEQPFEDDFGFNDEEEASPVQPAPGTEIEQEAASADYDKYVNKEFEPFKENRFEGFDFQKLFLGGIFNKIGAVAIIIALVVFINLVVPFKGLAGFLAGFLFLGYGFYLHKDEKLKKFAEVLSGTGFALLFIMTFCSYTVFHFFSTPAVIIAGIVLLIATYIYAEKTKTLSVPAIGLIGAYLTPYCASADSEILLAYFIFINIVSVIFSLKNRKANIINPINLVLTMLIFICLHFQESISAAYPVILWAIYIIYDFIRDKSDKIDNMLCYINYGILTLFSVIMFRESYPQLASLLGISTAFYAAAAFRSRKQGTSLYKFYEYSMLTNLWLAIFFAWDAYTNALVWAFIAPLISFVTVKYDAKHLKGGIIAYYASCLLAAFYAKYNGEYCLFAQYQPIVNPRFFLFLLPAASMALSARIFGKDDFKIKNLLLFTGISTAYLYLIGEINSISAVNGNFDENKIFIYVITGFIYSVNMLKSGVLYNSDLFKSAGNVILYLSLTWLLCIFSIYPGNHLPVFNLHFAAYAACIAACILYAKEYKDDKTVCEVFKFTALTAAYLCIAGEIITYMNTDISENFNKQMLLIILAFIYAINTVRMYAKTEALIYKTAGNILFALAFIFLVLLSFNRPYDYITVVNLRFGAYIALFFACITFSEVYKSDLFKYLAVFSGFLLCNIEGDSLKEYDENLKYAVSPLCAIYSGVITALGIIKNKNFLMNAGIVLTIITIIRIFVFDLANVDTVWKVVAFFVLGIILLAISYIYASKITKK